MCRLCYRDTHPPDMPELEESDSVAHAIVDYTHLNMTTSASASSGVQFPTLYQMTFQCASCDREATLQTSSPESQHHRCPDCQQLVCDPCSRYAHCHAHGWQIRGSAPPRGDDPCPDEDRYLFICSICEEDVVVIMVMFLEDTGLGEGLNTGLNTRLGTRLNT